MLKLKNIKKKYIIGEIETTALQGISVNFREKEFVAILGVSGSGKTTCLNIIGGLDRYDSGELTIKGKKTSSFKDKDWDAYRNNSIGFVFQSYNLISHLNIVTNVEMSMTLSGVSRSEKRKKAIDILKEVGLEEHIHKRPNQLSGGQMQRVAIARALVNNPEILLCDEPTGALDSETSTQIMDLITKISKDRLVIMVTHNAKLAKAYTNRIIQFEDGKIIGDTNPYEEKDTVDGFNLKHTSMSFLTALNLSFNNLLTKKGRTFLTAFASSIGIIGIAVILSLSNGFQLQIDKFQTDALAEFPIVINNLTASMNMEDMQGFGDDLDDTAPEYPAGNKILTYDSAARMRLHENDFTDKFLNYLNNIDPSIASAIGYSNVVGFNLLNETDNGIKSVSIAEGFTSMDIGMGAMSGGMSTIVSYPTQLDPSKSSYLESNYDILAGKLPESDTELLLIVDSRNRVEVGILRDFGFAISKDENLDDYALSFEDFINKELKIVPNNRFYQKTSSGLFVPNTDFDDMYNSEDNLTLKISGVVRIKADIPFGLFSPGIIYSDKLTEKIVEMNTDSDIVTAQKSSDVDVFKGAAFAQSSLMSKGVTKEDFLISLGANSTPSTITIYPSAFTEKDNLKKYLDDYTKDNPDNEIVYTDYSESITGLTKGIMDGITVVLVAFAAISLVVSLVMIAIIIYTSVLERTKEIGILRALGARKKDISRVFNAETFILGLFSGVLGMAIAYLLTFPVNNIIFSLTELSNVAQLKWEHVIALITISTLLTVLGGFIPSKIAAKKDAVEALRVD